LQSLLSFYFFQSFTLIHSFLIFKGKEFFADGSRYEGEYKDGKSNG